MAKGVEGSDKAEEVKIEVAENRVMAHMGFKEVKKFLWGNGGGILFEVGFE